MTAAAGTRPRSPPPWADADAVHARLEGRWMLARDIEGQARMSGVAVFERQPGGMLHYREDGRVRLRDGQAFDAHREYRFASAPGGFDVFFAEEPPRLFHRIALALAPDGESLAGAASHLCAPDHYDSCYRFADDGSFVVRHVVRGPRKDYVSVTLYRRPEAPAPRDPTT